MLTPADELAPYAYRSGATFSPSVDGIGSSCFTGPASHATRTSLKNVFTCRSVGAVTKTLEFFRYRTSHQSGSPAAE